MEPIILFLTGWKKKEITLPQLMAGANRPRKPVLRVMDRLAREGYVTEVADDKIKPGWGEFGRRRRNPTWRIDKKPTYAPPVPKRLTVRDKMWRIIRARRRFTRRELMRLAASSTSSATDFTQLLHRHGYLRITGKDNKQHVYLLIKDPGPQRPILKEIKK